MLRLFFAVFPSPCAINIPKKSHNLVRICLLPFSLARTPHDWRGRPGLVTAWLQTRSSCLQTAPGKQERAPCDAGDGTSGFLFYAVPADASLTQFTAYKPSHWTTSSRERQDWRSATEFSLPRPCSPVKTVHWFLCVQRSISTHFNWNWIRA